MAVTGSLMDRRPGALQESAVVLAHVWRALGLHFSKHRVQSGRKFLGGMRPGSDETRLSVLRDMVRAFVEAGYVHVAEEGLLGRAREEVEHSLTHAIKHWDHFVGIRRGLGRPVATTDMVRYLRFATIDLALRTAAFDVMFGAFVPPLIKGGETDAQQPLWSCVQGMHTWLRALPEELGVTRDKLHPGKSKDDWFYRQGRPSIVNVRLLATSLSKLSKERGNVAIDRWRTFLAWGFALQALCNDLTSVVGRAVIEQVALLFCRLRSLARQILTKRHSVHGEALLPSILRAGTQSPHARLVIDQLVTVEGLKALNGDLVDDRLRTLAMELRGCQGAWILGELFPEALAPIPPPEVPEHVRDQLVAAMAPGADPAALGRVAFTHPASMLWALRVCVQRAFLHGSFAMVAPAVGVFADAFGGPEIQLEAATLFLLAGDRGEARRRLSQSDANQGEVVRILLDRKRPISDPAARI
jgi:hypothetical protein